MKLSLLSVALMAASFGVAAQQISVTVVDSNNTLVSGAGTQVTYGASGVRVKLPVSLSGDNGGGGDTGGGDTGGGDTGGGDTGGGDTGGGDASTCGPVPSNVTIEKTGSIAVGYKQKQFNPSASQIVAFEFTAPSSGGSGSFTATKTTAANVSKLVSISACPGDWQNLVVMANGCLAYSTESSRVQFTTSQGADSRNTCVLQPGRTYYVNAVATNSFTKLQATCSTSSNCGFYGVRN